MFMKKVYKKPEVEFTEIIEVYGLLLGDSGEVDPSDPGGGMEGKTTNMVEEETGIPNKFSNIWGEEDED